MKNWNTLILYISGLLLLISSLLLPFASAEQPEIQLAKRFEKQSSLPITQYFVSEKLDGVRAYWDGKKLVTRSGNIINAPQWFISDFPQEHVEGELWTDRGEFDAISSIVRQNQASDKAWISVKFMLFDLPQSAETFEARYKALKAIAKQSVYLYAIDQKTFSNITDLYQELDRVVGLGGEGLMLHDKKARYHAGRTSNIVKLKPKFDAEAKVVGYQPGKGKYTGMLGALIVELDDGTVFEIGTGFSDVERQHPPKIGDTITFQYLGLTKSGKPRFASFLRVRYHE